MNLRVESRDGGHAIITPVGRLDLLTAGEMKKELARVVGSGHIRVVIDLENVESVDSSGLGALISGLKAARLAGGDLRIARPVEQVRYILGLSTLDRVLKPYGTVEDALNAFG